MTQPVNVSDLVPLLESTDLQVLEEVKGIVTEHLRSDRGPLLLNALVDHYLEHNSVLAVQILSAVQEPHDKHLLDRLNECMGKTATRLPAVTLLGHVIRREPTWIHKLFRAPVLVSLLKCLKTETEVVVLTTGLLVLIILLPMIPQAGKQYLLDFFEIFGRLAAWSLQKPGQVPEVYLIHLHASVYALFHRLYGMYPCNFVSYLRSHYSMKENMETFEEVVKPMLEHVRIHPELVTGTKDRELDPIKWKRFETHDIVIECAKVSLDPKEASCEEGYTVMPKHFSTHTQHKPADHSSSPFSDSQSSFGSASSSTYTPRVPFSNLPGSQAHYKTPPTLQRLPADGIQDTLWSPSSACGLSTPPSSRGLSPSPFESASCLHRVHSTPGGKGSSTEAPTLSPPPPCPADELMHSSLPTAASLPRKDGKLESGKPLIKQRHVTSDKGAAESPGGFENESIKTVSLKELPEVIKGLNLQPAGTEKENEEAAIADELSEITPMDLQSLVTRGGFDSPFQHRTETLTGPQMKREQEFYSSASEQGLCPEPQQALPSTCKASDHHRREQCPIKQGFMPIEKPSENCSGSPVKQEMLKAGSTSLDVFTPSPLLKVQALRHPSLGSGHPLPYEHLFDLALPKTASLFIKQKTSELQKVAAEHSEDPVLQSSAPISPLDVLDKLIQHGGDAHVKELSRVCPVQHEPQSQRKMVRLPLPSKSADWTHFGGSVPMDELQRLRNQLILLHNQLLYERYKREQHAVRNRRLLRKILKATALEEQNLAMKDQLQLQELDIGSLKHSLFIEQNQSRLLREEKESIVKHLNSQIADLQKERGDYRASCQELQNKLQDCQKMIGELKLELQKANNKACNTAYLLNQMTEKFTSTQSVQQQMEWLNKQLLLLSEVNELHMEKLLHSQMGSAKAAEAEMLQISLVREREKMKHRIQQQNQRLEASQRRIMELENHLTKKEHLFLEQKKYLENVKNMASGELQAAESRYEAQKRITQTLQCEILELYSKLERAGPPEKPVTAERTPRPVEDMSENTSAISDSFDKSPDMESANHQVQPAVGPSTSTDRSPERKLQPSLMVAEQGEVSQGTLSPNLLEQPTTPVTVGSYPSSKSLLGMRARELFRNKSESQCDNERPKMDSLFDSLKTEYSVELGDSLGPMKLQVSSPESVRQLSIMDYDGTHHDQN
ncbi:TSC complex subunit 1b isoform X2 [Hemiscyllium ocellatum]|uniref:TSC complex subunit 1b isoform X2 n=1 Tax=Hemiscyllium ocellatum TaxID=170820 RepID=UPI00296605B9|nr:TSC complex subunit 1b isoform X2 [Hemiscyllium ocellatum]